MAIGLRFSVFSENEYSVTTFPALADSRHGEFVIKKPLNRQPKTDN